MKFWRVKQMTKNKFNIGDKVVVVGTKESLNNINLLNIITAVETGDFDIAELRAGMVGVVSFSECDEDKIGYVVEFEDKHACCLEENIKAFEEENKEEPNEEPNTDEDDYCLELKIKKVGNRFVGNLSGTDDAIELVTQLLDKTGFEKE